MSGCWFGLVDLGVVLAGQTHSKNGRGEGLGTDMLPVKIKAHQALQQCETPESTQGKPGARNSPRHPLQPPLVLNSNPAPSGVKMLPEIILAISSAHMVTLGVQKLDTAFPHVK